MSSKRAEEKQQKILSKLQSLPENRTCAECPNPGPSYINLFNYTFVCTRCSGLLRELNHRLKSTTAASFTPAELKALQDGGNEIAAKIWLASHSPSTNPFPTGNDTNLLKEFMRQKYTDRRWYSEKVANEIASNPNKPSASENESSSVSVSDFLSGPSTGTLRKHHQNSNSSLPDLVVNETARRTPRIRQSPLSPTIPQSNSARFEDNSDNAFASSPDLIQPQPQKNEFNNDFGTPNQQNDDMFASSGFNPPVARPNNIPVPSLRSPTTGKPTPSQAPAFAGGFPPNLPQTSPGFSVQGSASPFAAPGTSNEFGQFQQQLDFGSQSQVPPPGSIYTHQRPKSITQVPTQFNNPPEFNPGTAVSDQFQQAPVPSTRPLSIVSPARMPPSNFPIPQNIASIPASPTRASVPQMPSTPSAANFPAFAQLPSSPPGGSFNAPQQTQRPPSVTGQMPPPPKAQLPSTAPPSLPPNNGFANLPLSAPPQQRPPSLPPNNGFANLPLPAAPQPRPPSLPPNNGFANLPLPPPQQQRPPPIPSAPRGQMLPPPPSSQQFSAIPAGIQQSPLPPPSHFGVPAVLPNFSNQQQQSGMPPPPPSNFAMSQGAAPPPLASMPRQMPGQQALPPFSSQPPVASKSLNRQSKVPPPPPQQQAAPSQPFGEPW